MSFIISVCLGMLGRVVLPAFLSWLILFFCLPSQQPVPALFRSILGTCKPLPSRQLRVGITPWAGFAGGLLANGGFHFNKIAQSSWNNQFGVEFVNVDGFDNRERMLSGNPCEGVDVLWSTVESWAGEFPRFVQHGIKARAIMQIAHPSHAHPLVADSRTRDLDDLGRFRLVVPLLSPSHWLLQGLPEKYWDTITPVDSTDAALDEFAGEKADAVAVGECQEYQALNRRRGSKRLSELDGELTYILVARETSIQQAPDLFKDFVQKWLDGNQDSYRRHDLVTRLIHDNTVVSDEPQDQIEAELDHAHMVSLAENMSMFGLDGGKAAFNQRFDDASGRWMRGKYLSNPEAAENAKDDKPLLAVFNEHPAVPSMKQLCEPGVSVEKDSSLTVVRFETGRSDIPPEYNRVLDGVVLALKTRRVQACIEGYTDHTGKDRRNRQLSSERAQVVADYLRKLGVAQGRMFPKGRGSARPLDTEDQSRRAEIKIVWEGK
jgi:outer membrane protein OmpA-like peptidoglycan-associated protein